MQTEQLPYEAGTVSLHTFTDEKIYILGLPVEFYAILIFLLSYNLIFEGNSPLKNSLWWIVCHAVSVVRLCFKNDSAKKATFNKS